MSQLKETLSKLTMKRATTLLGPQGKDLIRAGGRYAIDLDLDVTLTDELFLLNIEKSLVTIKASGNVASGLELRCSTCARPCEHTGAALAVILEEKLALALAARPSASKPAEELTPEELAALALADREERAASDRELAEALKSKLATCMERDEQGRLQMTVTLPDDQAVEHLALSLAKILGGAVPSPAI